MDLKKVDITSKVNGKMVDGTMSLYIGDAKIGEIIETNQGLQHEMAEGYLFKEDKIYRFENAEPQEVESYVNGCDEGWC
ncbi:YusG family protein [Halalkalibacter urbisdiaboli]|uniref:YusG family protein n=1 Tax=Halalkalibacter urbisdiaboli TaxID=1960589 RepID=UPI000B42DF51|nr:YusG family protein [Halalkalibacter urbisdiaboli]